MIKRLILGIVALAQVTVYAMEKSNISSTTLLENARQLIELKGYQDAYKLLEKAAGLNDQPFSELAKIGMRLTEIENLQDSAIKLERNRLFSRSIGLLTNAIEKKGYTEGYLFLGDIYFRQALDSENIQQKKDFYTKALAAYTTGSNKGSVLCKLGINLVLLAKDQEEDGDKWPVIYFSMIKYSDDLIKQFQQETNSERKNILGNQCLAWLRVINSFGLLIFESIMIHMINNEL